jgi:glycyl-tRNA synthetase beta chain
MVREKEFSALQGLMGREYASASGEDREVAQAIFEHYLPRFAGDMLPETQTGSILALADKLDTIVGCFGAGLIPTGSEDPFALRRQATGFVRILIDKGIHLDINEAIDYATGLYASKFPAEAGSPAAEVYRFLEQRLKTVLVDAGNRADLVDSAVPGVDLRDPVLMAKKVEAIKCFQDDPRFLKLVTAYKRAFNIWFSAGMREGEVDEALLGSTQTEEGRAEWNLYQAYQGIRDRYSELMGAYRFGEVLQLLLELATPVDVFFDKVMVMVDDEKVKQNRINLLGRVADLFLQIADFSKVEVG